MRDMDLFGGASRQQDTSLPAQWSEETQQCLVKLNLMLSGYAETCRSAGIPGVGEMYAKLQETIAEINRGGPSKLEQKVDEAVSRSSAVFQAMRALR